MSLSDSEKEDLLKIIEVLFGHDSEISRLKDSFSVRTVEAVEEALETLVRCNANMRSLVLGLVGGASLFVRGWLRQILSKLRSELESKRINFDGLACRVVMAYNWRSAIIISTH